jgi:hypothetical protein
VTTATQDGEWCNFFWLPSLSADPSVRRHLGKSWFQHMARQPWKATMAFTALRGQRHGGSGPRTTAMGARRHEGTNATGATPRGHQRHKGTNATAHIQHVRPHDSARPAYCRGNLGDHHGLHGLRRPHLQSSSCKSLIQHCNFGVENFQL